MSRKNVVICVSWPYANNNLHLGYIASSLSGDILARYHRMNGDRVLMISGSDSHGTKPSIKAKQQGCSPKDIVDVYHKNFKEALNAFDFSFDNFGITYEEHHKSNAKEFFKKLYENGYLYEKNNLRPFCPTCNKFVADTEVEITCPLCKAKTKADNCDCGYVPNEQDLSDATCLVCGTKTFQKENKVLVFKLTAFKDFLENHVEKNKGFWRANSINETNKYLKDLRDRDFSRDLDWGVEIPIKGFEDKVVWVWWEALLGYVTGSMKVAKDQGFDWQDFWKTDHDTDAEKVIYLCHAKDNIVFHSMFLPAMLEGLHDNFVTPNRMVSAEYLLMDDQKISKSRNGNSFEALKWAQEYNTDTLRFFFAVNGPEKRDTNFSLDLYANTHNEIVNKFGNLVNRTLKYKGLTNLPAGNIDKSIEEAVKSCYDNVAREIENIEFKKAGNLVMDLIVEGNKYFDDRKPWFDAKENIAEFNNTIYTCAYLIANLANLVEPFMPKSAKKLREVLQLDATPTWTPIAPKAGLELNLTEPLFTRM